MGSVPKQIAILGSTGSIGQSTLSIVESYPERYAVGTLAAGRNVDEAFAQCLRWRPLVVSLATEELADALLQRLRAAGHAGTEVVYGTEGTVRVATHPAVDFVEFVVQRFILIRIPEFLFDPSLTLHTFWQSN